MSGFLLFLDANLIISVEMSRMVLTWFVMRWKITLLRMKKHPRLKTLSVRKYLTLKTSNKSLVDHNSRRRLSQKAAYMADTPTRKRKDPVRVAPRS